MVDAPATPAAPAAPASPSITFGSQPSAPAAPAAEPVAPKTPDAGTQGKQPDAQVETADKFEFLFDGDEETYSFEDKPEAAAPADSYDASKPFPKEAEAALKTLSGKLVIEGRVEEAVLEDLLRRGHKAEMGDPWSEGRLSAARM